MVPHSFDLHFSNDSDVEHLFMCLLAPCISFLEFFAHFLIELFVFVEFWKFSIYSGH